MAQRGLVTFPRSHSPHGRAGLDMGPWDSWSSIATFPEHSPFVVARGVGGETRGCLGVIGTSGPLDDGRAT